jgi:hypothetical protein
VYACVCVARIGGKIQWRGVPAVSVGFPFSDSRTTKKEMEIEIFEKKFEYWEWAFAGSRGWMGSVFGSFVVQSFHFTAIIAGRGVQTSVRFTMK